MNNKIQIRRYQEGDAKFLHVHGVQGQILPFAFIHKRRRVWD